jgi:hypothetical protein
MRDIISGNTFGRLTAQGAFPSPPIIEAATIAPTACPRPPLPRPPLLPRLPPMPMPRNAGAGAPPIAQGPLPSEPDIEEDTIEPTLALRDTL